MKTCIIGASGYSGRELVCLLLDHPNATLERVTSRSLEGKKVEDCIPKLRGKGCELSFSNPSIEELSQDEDSELFFLALPHGTAAEYAVPLLEAGKKVIDLSADFRLNCPETYEEFYGQPHPAPEWLEKASYGLPELYELSWEISPLIASPGCYPTSILIPLSILLRENIVKKEGIVANSMSGISGAGRNATEKLLYCERNESAGAYGLPKHRHLSEIEEQLSLLSMNSSEKVVISFHPHLVSHEQRNMLDCVRSGRRRIGQAKGCRLLEPDLRPPPFRQSFARRRVPGRRSCGGDQPDRSLGPR